MSGTLYVVATPIGNLDDFSQRAQSIFNAVDYILAEDTRVTLRLLQHFQISKKLFSYSEYSSDEKDAAILTNLRDGKNYALVSDAGTPGISDPGARIVGLALENEITVLPVSGPSAIATIASVFGAPFSSLHFWGFFPMKQIRQRELVEYFQNIPGLHIFFESPFRVQKTFEKYLVPLTDFRVLIGREMTKKFESYYYGAPTDALAKMLADPVKGEFCIALQREKI